MTEVCMYTVAVSIELDIFTKSHLNSLYGALVPQTFDRVKGKSKTEKEMVYLCMKLI